MVSRRSFLLNAGSLAASGLYGLEAFGQASAVSRNASSASTPSQANGTCRTFYVAPTGEDGDYPERGTIQRPFATLPHAFAHAYGGDTILLRGENTASTVPPKDGFSLVATESRDARSSSRTIPASLP